MARLDADEKAKKRMQRDSNPQRKKKMRTTLLKEPEANTARAGIS